MTSIETATPASIINGASKPSMNDTQQQPDTITPSSVGGPSNGTLGASTPTKPLKNVGGGKRIEVDGMMNEFQKLLGSNWDRYRDVVTGFLTGTLFGYWAEIQILIFFLGKLTRGELQEELDQILDKNLVHMHNQFLLANLANALRDAPQSENGMLTGWSKKNNDSPRSVKGDSQLAKLKEDIMELTVRERKRIKAIAKEPNKRPVNQPNTIQQTRQAMLPRIPFVSDKDKNKQVAPGASPARASPQPASSSSPAAASGGAVSSSSSATQPANPVAWTQDILHAYEAPLASDIYELPDADSLTTRMLGISLEHGLLQGIGSQVPELMVTGLECYLRDLVEQVFSRVKLRKKHGDEYIMTAEDVSNVLQSAPTCFVEMNGPAYRLQDVMITDNDVDMEQAPDSDNATTPELQNLLDEILSK